MTAVDRRGAQSYVRFRLGQDDLPFGAVEDDGPLPERALKLAATIMTANGATASGSVDLFPDPTVAADRSGASTVVLRQAHEGVPVFEAQQVIGFRADGKVDLVQSRVVPVIERPLPNITVPADAALAIARGAVSPADYPSAETAGDYVLVAAFAGLPERPMLFSVPGLAEPACAHLLWFPLPDGLHLAWLLDLPPDAEGAAYRVIVSAVDGTVHYRAITAHGLAQSGLVFTLNPGSSRVEVTLPRAWTDYPVEPPAGLDGSPAAWASGDRTRGYSVQAFDADTGQPFVGTADGAGVRFAPDDPDGQDQRIVNAFYASAMMHDFARVLGFGPADGAYDEQSAFDGLTGRAIRVAVSTDPVMSVANWWRGTIRLGPHQSGRHSALDVTIVAHEYMHGISNRLVGGGLDDAPLVDEQSRGMAEGWSDYFACIATGQDVIGAWLAGDAAKGIRRFTYDSAFPVESANLGILASLSTYQIGEMWCAFLHEVTRTIGVKVAPLLVLDGMRGLLSNPSLLDGRDNMLVKLDRWVAAGLIGHETAAGYATAIWRAAGRFGMGKAAKVSGTGVEGATPDFTAVGDR